MENYGMIIKLVVFYSLTGAFVFTLIVTCLSMIGVIKTLDKTLKKTLYKVLIVEVCVAAVGAYANLLNINPLKVSEEIRQDERTEIVKTLVQNTLESSGDSVLLDPQLRGKVVADLQTYQQIAPSALGDMVGSIAVSLDSLGSAGITPSDSTRLVANLENKATAIRKFRPDLSKRRDIKKVEPK